MDDVYELFRRGTELLEAGHNHQATIPLSRARDLAPDKTSIREALGRALFRSARYEQACREFEAVVDRDPPAVPSPVADAFERERHLGLLRLVAGVAGGRHRVIGSSAGRPEVKGPSRGGRNPGLVAQLMLP